MIGTRAIKFLLYSVLLLFAGIAISGCTEHESLDITRHFEASFCNVTKTAVSSEGSVTWTAGDQIHYYCDNPADIRSAAITEDAEVASFDLAISSSSTYLVAVFGSSSITDNSGESLTLSNAVRAEQDGSFKQGHIAVGKTTDLKEGKILFHNVVSFISFSTEITDIDHFIFTATGGESLHDNGNLSIAINDSGFVPSFATSDNSSITISAGESGTFFIATIPQVLSSGFTITCCDKDGNVLYTATGGNALTINRSSIIRLGSIDSHLVDKNGIRYKDFGDDSHWDGKDSSNGNISFNVYGSDYNWDSSSSTDGSFNNNEYGEDSNWNSTSSSNGSINANTYSSETNWN